MSGTANEALLRKRIVELEEQIAEQAVELVETQGERDRWRLLYERHREHSNRWFEVCKQRTREWRTERNRAVHYEDLVRRAVHFVHGWEPDQPRWSAVGCVFSIGSTSASKLCSEFDLNPDEVCEGPKL